MGLEPIPHCHPHCMLRPFPLPSAITPTVPNVFGFVNLG